MDIIYDPGTAGHDTGKYEITYGHRFALDTVGHLGLDAIAELSKSPHWQDRIRAEYLRHHRRVTLPDQFPCIYETPDSPNRAGTPMPDGFAWVTSPDEDLLHAVLADYQELWDCYTSQWGPNRRRIFEVGKLDGLSPHGVYRPGTTPEQVLATTMLLHEEMYRRAPLRIRKHHPMFEIWTGAQT